MHSSDKDTGENMIGIVGATDFEMKELLEVIEVKEKKEIGGFTFYEGIFAGKDIVASKCGIGKVFASTCCQTMLLNYNVFSIVNIGAAGALIPELKKGDVVLVDETVQYDMDTTAFGDPLGLISGINIVGFQCVMHPLLGMLLDDRNIKWRIGNDATADRFCTDADTKKMLVDKFACMSVDMEAAAIAQVCYINNKPFESIKIISDSANDDSTEDYNEFTGTVGERVVEILALRMMAEARK